MITKIEKAMVNESDYDIKTYIEMAEAIARKKIEMYSNLISNIQDFKERFGHLY